MVNIKIFLLLSLVSFVACGGGPGSPNDDSPVEELPKDGAPLTLTGESSKPLNKDQPTGEDSEDEAYEEKRVIMVEDNDDSIEQLSNDDEDRLSDPSNTLNEDDSIEQLSNDDEDRLSDPSNPLNEDDSIEQLSNDDEDRLSVPSNPLNEGFIGIQDNNIDVPFYNLGVSDGVNRNINRVDLYFPMSSPVVSTSGLHSSRSKTHRSWTFTSPGSQSLSQGNNVGGTQSSDFWGGGVRIYIKDDTISIDNKKVQGITESRRSFVIKWNAGVLYVDGIPQAEFNGIQGTGTLEFLA